MSEDYSQPDFYCFNEDSLKLVKWILKKEIKTDSILDLGAGSGVIGIELARVLKPKRLTLVELQEEYLLHLKINLERFAVLGEVLIKSFSEFDPEERYDLIVCNPPYYLPGKGELAKDERRALARSFIRDSWMVLLETISRSLSADGQAYLVLKKDDGLFEMIQKQTTLKVSRTDDQNVMFISIGYK